VPEAPRGSTLVSTGHVMGRGLHDQIRDKIVSTIIELQYLLSLKICYASVSRETDGHLDHASREGGRPDLATSL
jgi:hypothetical protein